MHDLNDAMDDLRAVIPYAHSPSVRKLSKIATLLLAKNYILMQANALEEMRKLVTYLSHTAGVPLPVLPTPPGRNEQVVSAKNIPIMDPNVAYFCRFKNALKGGHDFSVILGIGTRFISQLH